MNHQDALELLGLDNRATPEDIRRAHRKLMMMNHPDRGGSQGIAQKLNEAKDLLLNK